MKISSCHAMEIHTFTPFVQLELFDNGWIAGFWEARWSFQRIAVHVRGNESVRSNKHSNTYRPVSGWSHSADFTAFTVQIRANIIPVVSTMTSGNCLLAIGLIGIHAFKPHFNLHNNTIVQVSSDVWRISPGGSDSALQGCDGSRICFHDNLLV